MSGPADPTATVYASFSGCFGGGPGRMDGETSGSLMLDTSLMMPGMTFTITVEISKDTRYDTAEVQLVVEAPLAPEVTVE